MPNKLLSICNHAIEYLFYALFFFVPLFFLPFNFELFEFNKMMATYTIALLIGGFWAVKMVLQGRIVIQRTPLDIPLLLFLASQIISTIVSIDVHTSVWGYYSRSNGGLASILTYIFLYYAFVTNVGAGSLQNFFRSHLFERRSNDKQVANFREKIAEQKNFRGRPQHQPVIKRLLLVALTSGMLVSIYGVLEHFGIDKDFWVQDVQNRVFSTLGQPNWLAAYLSVLIPIALAFRLNVTRDRANVTRKNPFLVTCYVLLATLFYITLLFTKSRSGFLGLWTGLIFFFVMYFWVQRKRISNVKYQMSNIKSFEIGDLKLVIIGIILLGITFLVGAPFEQFNKFTLEGIRSRLQPTTPNLQTANKPQGTALETGGTESGEIRKIVWKGAIDIAKHYPLFGSGVETFAYSYYKFRPVEHNQTSEWDFLYNKAHNEYLNYLANTGLFGLGSYLLIIGTFIVLCIRYYVLSVKRKIHNTYYLILTTSLLAGYLSILVSNFFGFSVVIINLFFFLIPAFVFVLSGILDPQKAYIFPMQKEVSGIKYQVLSIQSVLILFIILTTYYLLLTTYLMWDADRIYALGRSLNKSGDYAEAYPKLVSAIQKRPGEPLFSEELSLNSAALAIASLEQTETTLSSQLAKEAIAQSDYTVKKGPNNPTYWRTRIRVFYTLSQADPQYEERALEAAKKASELSPTDPKIAYNYSLILGQTGKLDETIAELERTVSLKPDYRDPQYALGLFYHEKATDEKGEVVNQDYLNRAIAQMEAVIKLASDDAEAKEKLKEWRGF